MNFLWQICWLELVIGCNRFAGLKEWAGSNGFARCTSKISPQKQIWRLEGMKIGPWHRICQVSKNILLPTNFLGPQYFAEAKVLQHYTGNFPTCQRIVPRMRKRLNMLCGNSWSILASASPTLWFGPKFWRRMHVANKTVRQAMHQAVRQRQDQALQQQFILRDNNNKTYYIQCNNQLELDNDYETA